jgi:hypothetical protein
LVWVRWLQWSEGLLAAWISGCGVCILLVSGYLRGEFGIGDDGETGRMKVVMSRAVMYGSTLELLCGKRMIFKGRLEGIGSRR